jgi:hypothetical protein
MTDDLDIEALIGRISTMTRAQLTDAVLNFPADFPLDFTQDYLDRLTLERLQHLLLAAHLHQARKRAKVSA